MIDDFIRTILSAIILSLNPHNVLTQVIRDEGLRRTTVFAKDIRDQGSSRGPWDVKTLARMAELFRGWPCADQVSYRVSCQEN